MGASVQERQLVAMIQGTANRFHELYARPYISRQDYDSWVRDYNQVENFARQNSGDKRIYQHWYNEEKPRFARSAEFLQSKIRTANPANYNTAVSISGGGDCCECGSSKIPQLPYAPVGNYGGGGSGSILPRGGSGVNIFSDSPDISIGDMFRDLFGTGGNPNTGEYPDSKLIDQSGIVSGIITALVVGGILWILHSVTKNKRNA